MTAIPDAVVVSAPAKINLFLHVGSRRQDGFHDLQSLVVFARAGDELKFAPAGELSLDIDGPFAGAITGDGDNLVLKAARALAADRGARITLTKNLPVASGIGGGSADAAAALRGLAQLWGLDLAPTRLREIGASLGSDIPVCVDGLPAWMEGRGERLTSLAGVPGAAMVLVNPGIQVPTAKVFAALDRRSGTALPLPPAMRELAALVAYLKTTANDLEAPARVLAPVIGDVLEALSAQPGALIARMSGSGATCFVLFEDEGAAGAASHALARRFPAWWIAATRMGGSGEAGEPP